MGWGLLDAMFYENQLTGVQSPRSPLNHDGIWHFFMSKPSARVLGKVS